MSSFTQLTAAPQMIVTRATTTTAVEAASAASKIALDLTIR